MTPPASVILCCSPRRPDRLDECWADEAAAASSPGLSSVILLTYSRTLARPWSFLCG